jgi:DNA-binding transcriptional LysR family regulator
VERDIGEVVFDRASKSPVLTQAGQILLEYGQRVLRLVGETESAVRELRDLRRGRVLVGSNEAGVHALLPLIALFREKHPKVTLDIRRVHARQLAAEVHQGSLDLGVLTFQPPESGLRVISLGSDELVLLVHPKHRLATRDKVTMQEMALETIIAHNEPSPVRDRVLHLFERRQLPLNIAIALPSLDGIKRAVELDMGVALLPRRCALTELALGRLAAVHVVGISGKRRIYLLSRDSTPSHAVRAFVATAQYRRAELDLDSPFRRGVERA